MTDKETLERPARTLLQVIGPGILYAAAAVGVSHLVQATRTGALFGLSLVSVIVFACLIKYPSLRFGSDYATATGHNLIHSYVRQGRWSTIIFLINLAATLFFIPAVVTLVTAALVKAVFGFQLNDVSMAACLLASAAIILIKGGYPWLERITKILVVIFTLLIVLAVISVIGRINWSIGNFAPPPLNQSTLIFIVAITGLMPAPLTLATMNSVWICAKTKASGQLPTQSEAVLDFNVGFATTLMLAVCFVLLGAGIMHGSGITFSTSSVGFAKQVIGLFTKALGDWSYWLVSAAALSIMYSTVLAVLDGYTRFTYHTLGLLVPELCHKTGLSQSRMYNLIVVLVSAGAVTMLLLFLQSFTTFIDLVSVIISITAPFLAALNHRSMYGAEVPISARPKRFFEIWSVLGISCMATVTLSYLYFKFLV